jgi:CelD/BcsL family acetyltransferase involved in cellulose biosynthesis
MAVLIEGAEALGLLRDSAFRDKLTRLYERCPWATRFQHWDFLSVWYEAYGSDFDPILIYLTNGDGLAGFFALAREKHTGKLIAGGGHQADYQVWLAEPDRSDAFVQAAFALLKATYNPRQMTVRYLPLLTPMGWAAGRLECGARVRLRPHARPILGLASTDHIEQALKKKSNKSRLNRLKRHGEVQLRVLTSEPELAEVLGEIGNQYDLRQGAMNGVSPFSEDPHKIRFHLDMMRHPGLLHASVLMAGDEVAAAILGLEDHDMVAICVYSYSPILAKHSPGKFLMLMLAAELAAKGKRGIDLTPGGEWKDRFATEHQQVLEATIYFRPADFRRDEAVEGVLSLGRKILAKFDSSPEQIRQTAQMLRRYLPGTLIKRAKTALWSDREVRIYSYEAGVTGDLAPTLGFARDKIADLLGYRPDSAGSDRQSFLSACETRLGEGHHAYSRIEDGRLVHSGWLADNQVEIALPEVEQSFALPDNTAVIYGNRTAPGETGRGLCRACVQSMLRDALATPARRVAVAVPGDEDSLRRVVEDLGFRRETTLRLTRRFGSKRTWRH